MLRVLIAALTICAPLASAAAQNKPFAFDPGTPQDDAAIRAILADAAADRSNPHVATNLDWETHSACATPI